MLPGRTHRLTVRHTSGPARPREGDRTSQRACRAIAVRAITSRPGYSCRFVAVIPADCRFGCRFKALSGVQNGNREGRVRPATTDVFAAVVADAVWRQKRIPRGRRACAQRARWSRLGFFSPVPTGHYRVVAEPSSTPPFSPYPPHRRLLCASTSQRRSADLTTGHAPSARSLSSVDRPRPSSTSAVATRWETPAAQRDWL